MGRDLYNRKEKVISAAERQLSEPWRLRSEIIMAFARARGLNVLPARDSLALQPIERSAPPVQQKGRLIGPVRRAKDGGAGLALPGLAWPCLALPGIACHGMAGQGGLEALV